MKLLVVGAGGLLGSDVVRHAGFREHEVVAATHADLDVTDQGAVRAALESHVPDAVVNCSGLTSVDACQRDPEAAYAANRDGPAHLAEGAARVGAVLVHVSTDYVFGGDRDEPYRPDDPTGPVNTYAASKLAGEEAVAASEAEHLICRVSWLYGAGRPSFVDWVLDQARQEEGVRVVEDQWSVPTWTATAAETILEVLERGGRGVFHTVDRGRASRLEQAREALRIVGLDPDIEPVARAELWPDVPRPRSTVLDTGATEAFLGRKMTHWKEALRRFLRI